MQFGVSRRHYPRAGVPNAFLRFSECRGAGSFYRCAETAGLILNVTPVANRRNATTHERAVLQSARCEATRGVSSHYAWRDRGRDLQVGLHAQGGVSKKNAHRVLINLHGGAFSVGAHTESDRIDSPCRHHAHQASGDTSPARTVLRASASSTSYLGD
jgi:hypothetical protein